MGLIKKIERDKAFEIMNDDQKSKFEVLEKELKPSSEFVVLGDDVFEVTSFDIKNNIAFSKLQQEYRDIVKANPNITFHELVEGENNVVGRILGFLGIETEVTNITFKQFKYLMWVIAKNYVFTEIGESNFINQMTPFFFIA